MAMKASTAKLIASDFVTLDLKRIRRFILEAAAEGAIAVLISTIIELLTRMRDLNQELMRQLAWKNRKRPASETTQTSPLRDSAKVKVFAFILRSPLRRTHIA